MRCTPISVVLTLLVALSWTAPTIAGEPVANSSLLPTATRACFSIPDPQALGDSWKETKLAALGRDSAMEPFLDAAREKFREASGDLRSFADVSLDDLMSAARGEVSLAVVEVGEGKSAVVAVATVDNDAAGSLIRRIDDGLERRGATPSTREAAGATIHRYEWRSRDGKTLTSAYATKGELLALSNESDMVAGVLERIDSAGGGNLAAVDAFRDIRLRCDAANGGLKPQVRWYIEPIANARLASGKEPDFAIKHGFGAVKAVGGTLNFDAPGYEVLARVAVYAPPPHERALRAAALLDDANALPPPWLIDDVDSYADLNVNLREVIDHVGGLFDELVADGIEGTFEDVLKDLASDEGPGVDIRADLLPLVGPRVVVVSDHTEPAEEDSSRTLIAIATSDQAAAARIVERLMQDDPDVTRVELPGYPHPLWQVSDSETASMPNMGMMVANGFILTSSNSAMIRKLLTAPVGAPKLADADDYKLVAGKMAALGAVGASLRMFSRQDRDFASTYATLRAGELEETTSVYADILRSLFGKDEYRLSGFPKLDFTTLPEFDAVKPFLGTQGVFVKNQANGWIIVGFVPK